MQQGLVNGVKGFVLKGFINDKTRHVVRISTVLMLTLTVAVVLAAAAIVAPAAWAAASTVRSFAPAGGPVGTSVVITGTNFGSSGTPTVTFNGTTAITVTRQSSTQCTATVPSGATTGRIGVTGSGYTVGYGPSFGVTSTITIASFTPTYGTAGTAVTLTGTNFSGATAVAFHGTAATSFTVVSATQITATVPAGATTGTISVTTAGGTATSAASFTVTVPVITPKITLHLSGLKSGAIKFGKSVTAKGTVKPTSLAGSKIMLTVQQKKGSKWVKVKSAMCKIGATGAYSWKYKPAKKGAYRMAPSIAKTATHTAATTKWLTFKVK